jgi:hypothetical protein
MEKISTALRCTKLDEKHMNSLEKVMCYQVFVDDGKIVGCFASKLSLGIARIANLCFIPQGHMNS